MQLHDAFSYVSSYNYGKRGNSKIFRCVEHQLCGKYLRIRKYACEETQQVEYDVEHRGKHSVDASTRKRTGTHPAFRVEVDTAVMAGGTPTKVVLELRKKF
ncbi:hypothetical protein BBJ28_00022505 [Nothophytophthora sp. Chile5]|nr:hypothetical protein BBJ28_00022505 [Nothophytophthora sp. Chile5]